MVLIFLDDTLRVVVGVERVHENEGHIDLVHFIQVLDLAHRKIEERHALTNFNGRFGRTTPAGWIESMSKHPALIQ